MTVWNRDDGNKHQTWYLSKVGNWDYFTESSATPIFQTRTHGATHELTAISLSGGSPNALSYDAKGNLTQDNTKSPTHNYVWDFDNRMSAADVDGAAGNEISYTYDALGRRVSKTFPVSGTPTTIVFVCATQPIEHSPHAGQVLAEYTSGALPASPLRKYVYASYVDEPVVLIDRTAAGVLPSGTEEKFYYHSNSLFKVAALTDAAGVVQERYAYTPYGQLEILDPTATTLRTVSSFGNPYTYTGRRLDNETGLYYYRARYFDAELGRFTGRDPISLSSHKKRAYVYVLSNPNIAVDPSGLIDVRTISLDDNNGEKQPEPAVLCGASHVLFQSYLVPRRLGFPKLAEVKPFFNVTSQLSVDRGCTGRKFAVIPDYTVKVNFFLPRRIAPKRPAAAKLLEVFDLVQSGEAQFEGNWRPITVEFNHGACKLREIHTSPRMASYQFDCMMPCELDSCVPVDETAVFHFEVGSILDRYHQDKMTLPSIRARWQINDLVEGIECCQLAGCTADVTISQGIIVSTP